MNSPQIEPSDELMLQYVLRRKEELGTYMRSLKTQDFTTISHIGHRMRGNGVSFGFPELSVLGEKIEEAAKKSDLTTLRVLSIEFTNWIDTQTMAGRAQ